MAEDRSDVEAPVPEPFLTGSFAMYATGSGEIILATHTNIMGEQKTRVPRFVVNQAKRSNPMLAQILEGAKTDGVG
jgi:hypothetical protein